MSPTKLPVDAAVGTKVWVALLPGENGEPFPSVTLGRVLPGKAAPYVKVMSAKTCGWIYVSLDRCTLRDEPAP